MPSQPSALEALPRNAVVAVADEGAASSRILRGFRSALIVVGLFARVIWLSLRRYPNPVRAVRALIGLRAAKRTREWATPSGTSARRWKSAKIVTASGRYFWDLYAPGWPSPAFDGHVRRELERVDSRRPTGLNTAIIAITRRCALKCEHCFEWDALSHAEALSAGELHEIVRRVYQRGIAQIFFSGGEPLQRFEDLLALSAAVSAGTDVWILTSGLGLTADRARRLRAAGVTGVALSLDHWDASAHDQFRGLPGAFDAVERGARHADDAGLLVALSLCPTRAFVTPANLDRYSETARSFDASFIQILEPKAVGHYAGQDVALTPAQQGLLEDFCRRLNTEIAGRDFPTVAYVDWSARALGCGGAGDRYIYIDTNGDLHACPFCRAPGLGVLDHDMDAALMTLQSAGCPSARSSATPPPPLAPRASAT